MRRWLGLALALVAVTASARPTTFGWDAHPDWPAGTTVELCGNGDVCLDGITDTQATLDLPVASGDVIEGRARAVAPAGYQCGDPPAPCSPYSDWATVAQTWPAVPVGGWARYQREETPVAELSLVAQNANTSVVKVTSATITLNGVGAGNLIVLVVGYLGNETTITVSDGTNSLTAGTPGLNPDTDFGDVWDQRFHVFYLLSSSSGNKTYTVTYGAARHQSLRAYAFSTSSGAWQLDGQASYGYGEGSTLTSGSLTTTGTDVVAIGFTQDWDEGTHSSPTIGGSAASGLQGGGQHGYTFYRVGTLSSGTAQVTTTTNVAWLAGLIAFKSVVESPSISLSSSANDSLLLTALSNAALTDNALSSDLRGSRALSSLGITDNSLSSDIYAAIASAVSGILDNASSSDQGPSYAAAIAAIIDAAIANASINSELIGAQLTEILDSASASDLFGPIAAAFGALRDGALAGDSWVSGAQAVAGFIEAAQAGDSAAITALARIVGAETAIAADAKGQQAYAQAVLSELAQADLSLVITSLADNEVLISESSQALDAFVSASQALARLSDTATALDAALAIVAASASISDAATAGDVYETFVGDFASSISGSALAGDQYQGTQTALAAIIEDAIVSMVLRSSALSVNRLDEAVAAMDGWQSIMGDSYRTITDASVAGDLIASRVTGYVAIVEAVAASAALYARAGSQIALSAMAIAGDRFLHTPVAEAVLQRLVVASIAISRAISGQANTSTRLAGWVYH